MRSIARALLFLCGVSLGTGCAIASSEATIAGEDALSTECAVTDELTAEDTRAFTTPALVAGAFGFATLDVGQGDAAVVVAPGGCVAVLDGGPTRSGKTIKDYLHALGVSRIDFAVVSHYHEDHLGGLDEVERGADAIPITTVYDHGGSYSSNAFSQYSTQFRNRRVTAQRGETISLCNQVAFEVVTSNANGASTSDENARSVGVKISYGALDLLVGGDLTGSGSDIETSIARAVGPIEIYKVHHHGSAGSSNARFLDVIRPTVSFISVAKDNSYGHPTAAALGRLRAVDTAIWQTALGSTPTQLGHLEVVSTDGRTFKVVQGSQSTSYASKAD